MELARSLLEGTESPRDLGRAHFYLAEAALQRQRWKSEVRDGAVTSNDRLQALQTAVTNQTYAPSPRAVAERLLSELAADLVA